MGYPKVRWFITIRSLFSWPFRVYDELSHPNWIPWISLMIYIIPLCSQMFPVSILTWPNEIPTSLNQHLGSFNIINIHLGWLNHHNINLELHLDLTRSEPALVDSLHSPLDARPALDCAGWPKWEIKNMYPPTRTFAHPPIMSPITKPWMSLLLLMSHIKRQHVRPPLNNLWNRLLTSTWLGQGIYIRHPLWTMCKIGWLHQLYCFMGYKSATPSEHYVKF